MSSVRPAYVPGSIDLDNTIGATYIGVLLSTFVAGIVFNQAFKYFRQFKNDIALFKISVATVQVLNLVHSGCIIAAQYFWSITGWGDVERIDISTTEYPVSFLLTGLVAMIVQLCYAYRIYIVSNRKPWIPLLITLLTLAQLGASFYCTIMAAKAGLQSKFLPYFNAAYVWLYGEAAADVIITATLLYYLQSVRDSTTFADTKSIARRLSIITFETNSLTLICCVLSAGLLQSRKDGWGPAINFLSAKVYALSLMVTLNARDNMKTSNSTSTMNSGTHHRFATQTHELDKFSHDVSNAVRVTKEAVSVAYQQRSPDINEKKDFVDIESFDGRA